MASKFVSFAALLLLLTGCITSKEVRMPDGSMGHHVTCGGTLFSMGDCIERAGNICGAKGYEVLGADRESNGFSNSSGGFNAGWTRTGGGAAGGFTSQSGNIVNRDLFIKCRS